MEIREIISEFKKATSTNLKKEVIKKHIQESEFKKLLYYVLNPISFPYIDTEMLDMVNVDDIHIKPYKDIFDCLDSIGTLRDVDMATLRKIKAFLNSCSDDERGIYEKILLKKLKLGISAKTVNSIESLTIPEWKVQQPSKEKFIYENKQCWIMPKVIGVRATYYNGMMIGVNGLTLDIPKYISDEIRFMHYAGFVLDGVLQLPKEAIDEYQIKNMRDYKNAVYKILNSKKSNKTTLLYSVFDVIPQTDFDLPNAKTDYSTRRTIIHQFKSYINDNNYRYTKVIPLAYRGIFTKDIEKKYSNFLVYFDSPYVKGVNKYLLSI